MIRADPIDSLIAIIPVGETKIPEPIIDPTTIDIPPRTDIFLLSWTPFLFSEEFFEPRDAKLSLCQHFSNYYFTRLRTVQWTKFMVQMNSLWIAEVICPGFWSKFRLWVPGVVRTDHDFEIFHKSRPDSGPTHFLTTTGTCPARARKPASRAGPSLNQESWSMMNVFNLRAFPVGCFGSHFLILFDWKINRSLNSTRKMTEKSYFCKY